MTVNQFKILIPLILFSILSREAAVTSKSGTDQVVIQQPMSNGHQKSFTIDCSFIDEGNETFEEKKWNETSGTSLTVNDVSGTTGGQVS